MLTTWNIKTFIKCLSIKMISIKRSLSCARKRIELSDTFKAFSEKRCGWWGARLQGASRKAKWFAKTYRSDVRRSEGKFIHTTQHPKKPKGKNFKDFCSGRHVYTSSSAERATSNKEKVYFLLPTAKFRFFPGFCRRKKLSLRDSSSEHASHGRLRRCSCFLIE